MQYLHFLSEQSALQYTGSHLQPMALSWSHRSYEYDSSMAALKLWWLSEPDTRVRMSALGKAHILAKIGPASVSVAAWVCSDAPDVMLVCAHTAPTCSTGCASLFRNSTSA